MPIKNNINPKTLSNISLYSNRILPTLDAAAPRIENAIEIDSQPELLRTKVHILFDLLCLN